MWCLFICKIGSYLISQSDVRKEIHLASRRNWKISSQYCGWPSRITSHGVYFQQENTTHHFHKLEVMLMPTENQVSLQQSTIAMWKEHAQAANLEGSNMPIWTWNLRGKFPAALVESLPHRIKTVLKTKGIKLGSICCSWLIIHTCTWHLRPVLQPVGRVVFLRKSCVFVQICF